MRFKIRNHPMSTVLILSAILFSTCYAIAQPAKDPRIEVDPETLDFGTMKQEDVRSLSVEIRNTGGALLIIEKVETSCGCTVAEPKEKELQPGASTSMLVTFDSKHFMGKQTKFIQVTSNDPAKPTVAVIAEAFVNVPIMFTPAYKSVNLGNSSQGEKAEKSIFIESQEVAELELSFSGLEGKPYTIEINDDPSGDKARKLVTFRTRPDAPIGHFREIVTFQSNVPQTESFDMDISGTIQSKIILQPEKFNLRYLVKGREEKRAVVVNIANNLDTKVLRAEIDVPGFKILKIVFLEPTNQYQVIFTGSPIDRSSPEAVKAKGRIKGNLTIYLDSAEIPKLQVPITYMLRM